MTDALAQSQAIASTAEANGWSVRGPDGTRNDARIELTKDSRIVRYEVRADRVDPDMGQAIVTVTPQDAAPATASPTTTK